MLGHLGFGLSRVGKLPPDHKRVSIPGGNSGTAATIARMRDLVTRDKRDFRVRTEVGKIIRSCPNKDYECFAKAIYNFCTHKIKYAFDPNGVELVERSYKILESGLADCDSIVVMAAAMCESIGLPCRFVTIKADTARPSDYSHVYLQVKVPRRGWIGMDCTMPDQAFGWEPPGNYKRKYWPASRDQAESHDTDEMAGLGMQHTINVPHVEHAKGVIVGKDWDFRDESALVTETPERMELEPISQQRVDPVGQSFDEFFIGVQAPAVAAREASQVQNSGVYAEPALTAQPVLSHSKWLGIGAAVLLGLALFGGKR